MKDQKIKIFSFLKRLKTTKERIGILNDEKKNAWKENFENFKGINNEVPDLL